MPVSTIDNSGISPSAAISTSKLGTGAVLQVVNATYGTASTSSSSYVDTGLTATITPTSATSKILVIVDVADVTKPNVSGAYGKFQLVRSSTSILVFGGQTGYNGATSQYNTIGASSANYLDSPATTSATTYKVQFAEINGGTLEVGSSGAYSTITLMEIAG